MAVSKGLLMNRYWYCDETLTGMKTTYKPK
jgi:hypothetical protein